ncbi:MAG: hypothetical protein AAFO29_22670 [Actinomycetota bacterium]
MARPLSRRRASRVAAALLAFSLGAAACGGSDDDTVTESGAASESASTGPVLDAAAFSGEATTIDGAMFDLAPLAEQDLVVWFWAPW